MVQRVQQRIVLSRHRAGRAALRDGADGGAALGQGHQRAAGGRARAPARRARPRRASAPRPRACQPPARAHHSPHHRQPSQGDPRREIRHIRKF